MSDSEKPPQCGPRGRWLNGHVYLKQWRDPTFAHSSKKLQEELQGVAGRAVMKRLFRAKCVPIMPV